MKRTNGTWRIHLKSLPDDLEPVTGLTRADYLQWARASNRIVEAVRADYGLKKS